MCRLSFENQNRAHFERQRQKERVTLMKRQVGSSRGRLTRTLFSVLSPLISSLTLFLSDSFTFLPTASRTLSEHRRQERDRLKFWTWRKKTFYFLALNKTPTWHQKRFIQMTALKRDRALSWKQAPPPSCIPVFMFRIITTLLITQLEARS